MNFQNEVLTRAVCLIIGYAFGCIQTAYIIGRKVGHIDIRKYGSGNAGTTNALRVLGRKWGIVTLICDILKAVAAVLITALIFGYDHKAMLLWSGLGVVIGHNRPFYMQFKGGKGVAAMIGIFLAADPRILAMAGIPALLLLLIFRYMSLSSVTYMGLLIAVTSFTYAGSEPEAFCLTALMALITIYRHRPNIKRLLNGTERKVGQREKIE